MAEPDSVQLTFSAPPGSEPQPDPLWKAATDQAHRASQQAETSLAQHRAAAAAWRKLADAFARDQADAAARVLGDSRLRPALELMPELRPTLERLRLASQTRIKSRTSRITDAARELAESNGWPASMTSAGLRVGHFVWVLPADAGTTKVGAQRVRSLSWDAVRPVLEAEYARLWAKSDDDVDRFMGDLESAIDQLQPDTVNSEYVRLRSVYNALAARKPKKHGAIPSYFRDEFSADLSLMLRRQRDSRVKSRYELAAIRNPELAFEVVQPDGSLAQFGFIRRR